MFVLFMFLAQPSLLREKKVAEKFGNYQKMPSVIQVGILFEFATKAVSRRQS